MRKLLFLFVFAFSFFHAQEIEEMQEGYFYAEGSNSFFRVDIKKPFDYYKNAKCGESQNFIRAQFEGGDAAFTRELFKYISAYVDKQIYVVNGNFFLHVDIDAQGKVTHLDITPKVENSEMFLKDLSYAFNRVKKTWTPSKCDGTPVDSKIRIKVNFMTENGDT
ncbi:hypothetical protein [Chryseobacterium koreense]|uniref:hypothetical protein n=1 Tax=Chryseobacterium koreense TaxID=232216 RepID=UPI0026ED3C52|nr:hypothetical protein [Chryseobacterium koreense]